MMPDSFELSRFIVAFFASGVFWLMVLFYAEKGWRRNGLPGAGVAAGIVLVSTAILFFKVVVDDAPWRTPPDADETSYSAPARPSMVGDPSKWGRHEMTRISTTIARHSGAGEAP